MKPCITVFDRHRCAAPGRARESIVDVVTLGGISVQEESGAGLLTLLLLEMLVIHASQAHRGKVIDNV